MQETNEKGQNYADNSISMQIEAIIEEHSHRPVQATKRIMRLLHMVIVEEILIAQTEGQPTSRLTSLANKLNERKQ